MPRALAVASTEAPPSRQAAATPPKIPQIAVGWKPRAWKAPEAAIPTRVTTSLPATIAAKSSGAAAAPASGARLGSGRRGRADDDTDVGDRIGVGVVEVETVAEHRVGERRVRRRQ